MAINQVLEPFNSQPSASSQTYVDLTFVFGPPNGERYDMLVSTARLIGDSVSKVYRTYIEEVFASFEEKNILDDAFSCVLGTDINTNDIFPTYQFWLKRKDKFEKFYLSPEEESVEIPAIMVFPPKFTLKSGSPLNINVETEHARYVSAFLGQALKLDWIDMSGTLSEQGGR